MNRGIHVSELRADDICHYGWPTAVVELVLASPGWAIDALRFPNHWGANIGEGLVGSTNQALKTVDVRLFESI